MLKIAQVTIHKLIDRARRFAIRVHSIVLCGVGVHRWTYRAFRCCSEHLHVEPPGLIEFSQADDLSIIPKEKSGKPFFSVSKDGFSGKWRAGETIEVTFDEW